MIKIRIRGLIFSILLIGLFCTGCYQQNINTYSKPVAVIPTDSIGATIVFGSTKSIEDGIKEYIQKNNRDMDIKNFKLASIYPVDGGIMTMFLFDGSKVKYEGMVMMLNKNNSTMEIINILCAPVDTRTSVTMNEMSGDYLAGNNRKIYFMLGGVINNPAIKELNIEFFNGIKKNYKLNDDNRFYCLKQESVSGIKSFTYTNKNGDVKQIIPLKE